MTDSARICQQLNEFSSLNYFCVFYIKDIYLWSDKELLMLKEYLFVTLIEVSVLDIPTFTQL